MLNFLLTQSPQLAAMAMNKPYMDVQQTHEVVHRMSWRKLVKTRSDKKGVQLTDAVLRERTT
ncbi:MAG: hypothetical protein AB7J35_04785 [Dehalococcoidia bacterium]